MIFDKFLEIKTEYFKTISEQYEDYLQLKKKLTEYSDKLKYLTKKYNRLNEKLDSLKYKSEVTQFLKKEDFNKKTNFTEIIRNELNIFQEFMSYQKEESSHYKLVNIMRKIFKNNMHKVNEEKSQVLNYFFERYPETKDNHRKTVEKPKIKKNSLQINSVDFSITSPNKTKKAEEMKPKIEKKEEENKLKKRNSVKGSLAKSGKSSSVKAVTTRSSNSKQIYKFSK